MFRRAGLAAAMTLTLIAAPASAATSDVSIVDFAFTGGSPTVALGGTVRWTNNGGSLHSTTSNAPLSLWSLDVAPGAKKSRSFKQAGSFAYHCRIHASMTGTVKVPLQATPSSGSGSTTFTIRVANLSAPAGYQYVIERKKPGGSFTAWKSITGQTTTFKSSVKGTWQFRSKLRKTSNGASSGFSPADSVTIS